MAQSSQEYVVRAPHDNNKRYNVMRFSNSLNVDVTNWKAVRMDRERGIKSERVVNEEAPKFGLGSEFGKDAREEARRKKYGSRRSKKDAEDVPWLLKVASKNGKNRYRGTREGGVTENTSYYVFFQAHDGAFEAFSVSEWYNFTSIPKFKALTAEEAEERFEKRDKILNHFAVMAQKKKQDAIDGEASALAGDTKLKKIKREKEFKVTELDEWGFDSDQSNEDESGEEGNKTKKKTKVKGKNKKAATKRKKKKGSDDDDDSEPGEESDEGDFDTREVDYMSDSSSSSEEEVEDKVNKEMKGVEDEDALRKLVISDDEEEEEDANKPKDPNAVVKPVIESEQKPTTTEEKAKTKNKKDGSDSESTSSDDSDDSDFDDSKFQSAMFMPGGSTNSGKIKNGSDQSASSSRANTPLAENGPKEAETNRKVSHNNKRKMNSDMNSSDGLIPNKKSRPSSHGNNDETISEEAVRRYLVRKPMTTPELLKKFRTKKIALSKEELVRKIAEILKRLNPERQTIKGKLYLSVRPD